MNDTTPTDYQAAYTRKAKPMRLMKVPGYLVTFCYRCGRRLESPPQAIYADLDGPSFRAYYCPTCADVVAADYRIAHHCPPDRGTFCPQDCVHRDRNNFGKCRVWAGIRYYDPEQEAR